MSKRDKQRTTLTWCSGIAVFYRSFLCDCVVDEESFEIFQGIFLRNLLKFSREFFEICHYSYATCRANQPREISPADIKWDLNFRGTHSGRSKPDSLS